MQTDEPAFLTVGTEVSAKFKGAFCEAKVKKVEKSVKCKILLKQTPFGSVTADDTMINGDLEINNLVEVVQSKQIYKGVIQTIKDCSLYTVVFNDGDERVLRRTAVCLKGGKHFAAEVNLDSLPLYNPDTFINWKGQRKKKRKAVTKLSSESEDDSTNQPSTSNLEAKNSSPVTNTESSLFKRTLTTPLKGISSTRSTTRAINALKFETSASKSPTPSLRANSLQAQISNQLDPVSNSDEDEKVEESDELSIKTKVNPKLKRSSNKVKQNLNSETSLSRLTQSTISSAKKRINLTPLFGKETKKMFTKPKERAMSESRSVSMKKTKNSNNETGSTGDLSEDKKILPGLVVVINEVIPPKTGGRIQLGLVVTQKEYKEHMTANKTQISKELPSSWEKKALNDEASTSKIAVEKPTTSKKQSRSSTESETSSEEDENYGEKRDRFVAHFYKFQDESEVVNQMGGHKRATQEFKWRKVLKKLHLKDCPGATPHTVKNAYLRYFEKFESFLKNLGYSCMNGTGPTSTFSRSSRTIRPVYESDWKRKKREREERKLKEKEAELQNNGKDMERSVSIDSQKALISHLREVSKEKQMENDLDQELKPDLMGEFNEKTEILKSEYLIERKTNEEILSETSKTDFTFKHDERKKDKDIIKNQKKIDKISEKFKDSPVKYPKAKSTNLEFENITEDELKKRIQQRRAASAKKAKKRAGTSHIKSQPVTEEQDIGFTNANIFTRFFLGQKVHARHRLRFYDARVITVRQPTLQEIAKEIRETFERASAAPDSRIPELSKLTVENMGDELKNILNKLVNESQCFVHYLGWNSRYDEWLMLHKVRVDMQDEMSSKKAVDNLIPGELPLELFTVTMDWCTTEEGIPALARIHAYTSHFERPRRLSSSNSSKSRKRKGLKALVNGRSEANNNEESNLEQLSYNDTNISTISECDEDVSTSTSKQIYSNQSVKTSQNKSMFNITTTSVMSQNESTSEVYPPLSLSTQTFNQQQQSSIQNLNRETTAIPSITIQRATQLSPQSNFKDLLKLPVTTQNFELYTNTVDTTTLVITNANLVDVYSNLSTNDFNIDSDSNQSALTAIPQLCTNEVFVDFESKMPKKLVEGYEQIKFDGKNSTNVSTTIKSLKNENFEAESDGSNMHVLAALATHSANIKQTMETTNIVEELTPQTPLNETSEVPYDTDESLCSSKIGSPLPLIQQQQKNRIGRKANLETQPLSGRASVVSLTQQSTELRLRGTKRFSKSPDGYVSSAAEENNEEIISHIDTSHAVRQRLLQRMETDNLFASYSFIGLPEIETVLQPDEMDSTSQIKSIEKQICRLREIYQTYRGKLTRLERRHKAAFTKKKNHKESLNNSKTTNKEPETQLSN